ncbi:efflux RND transporter permease subunit [Flammeovirga kamogawensis]|uniref:Efflux RND transporter permease subunit n=1 Tax=Flammeovirga kamogawensis TaxID=373891 RepID=A0ABX8H4W5_9BACT|nr:efflux RND transporter permease subunit [Flammeovirga kamogawensis]MBB6461763.1 multidrug efflux pump subunit AcrB [Flammeovirga kamogawensis]QWG10679.1 efflux RND transporter permease subunit [Flammeovirga kamogawensis]TRX63782.1 efflux RND transporter permease subunit [Flammeovirga kamogawensis]
MQKGIAGKIAEVFINSKLTPLLMFVFIGLGIYGSALTPREEEPQIDVPIADLFIGYPGATPEEVEARIAKPIEKMAANIKGVEYVYSTSMNEQAMVIVQFLVGQDIERSIVKLYAELDKHKAAMPKGVTQPIIKVRAIDDVPALSLTFHSNKYDDFMLRRIGEEAGTEIAKINDIAQVKVIGGRSREMRVELDREKMKSFKVDPLLISQQIQAANQQMSSGTFNLGNTNFSVKSGAFFKNVDELKHLVIGVNNGNLIYLDQVANIIDGPAEPIQYVRYGNGVSSPKKSSGDESAITLSIAKRKGADAMKLADLVLSKTEHLKETLIPKEVEVAVTRNYGESASHKVNELLMHLIGSIIAVTIVVALSMGWRGGLVVFLSVPVTFALTLFSYYLLGYTLNRITLFALVFVTGIVVDDSIIIAENMHRHFKMRKLPFMQAALASINEVGNPTILATFTVIASVLPMIAVSGMMGPYMSPMPIGAAFAMFFSLIVALVITPFIAYRLLKGDAHNEEEVFRVENTVIYKVYNKTMRPLIERPVLRWTFIVSITTMLLGSLSMFYFDMVVVKMLPFDNKNEFQVVIDMPEGTPLEETYQVTKELAAYIRKQQEVVAYQMYVGTSSPNTFNGLVRHYDLRRGPNVADIQVNLTDKSTRSLQSHDLAKAMRPGIQKLATQLGANIKVVEVPPGPPVLSTLVAEIYGPDLKGQEKVAEQVYTVFENSKDIVDVDAYTEADQIEYTFDVDKEKAALAGISTQQIVHIMNVALRGFNVSKIEAPNEYGEVAIKLVLKETNRTSIEDLKSISVKSMQGKMVAIGDLVKVHQSIRPKSIYRKNQKRVTYVVADVAGKMESPIYAMLGIDSDLSSIITPNGKALTQNFTAVPFFEDDYVLKWDGEWQITFEVFRDLGAAFAVVLVIIYMLIVGWFQDFKTPIVMMVAIPLAMVGILVGHWMLGAFFTATSMIGAIALAGIMVRNSVLLIDFINIKLEEGAPLKEAVIEAGAVRTMPILLTAGTVVIGAFVILFDPIFQGLAISLMGGTIASTALTLLIVPLVFFMTEKKKYQE